MNRLTKKEKTIYAPTECGAQFLEPDDGSNAARLLQVIGKYEDVMEKYGIKDTKDLDERLGIYQALADRDYTAIDKPAYEAMMSDISEYRKAEKELGIEITTLFKLLKQGFVYIRDGALIEKNQGFIIDHIGLWSQVKLDPKDYGKTWALTKEELEK